MAAPDPSGDQPSSCPACGAALPLGAAACGDCGLSLGLVEEQVGAPEELLPPTWAPPLAHVCLLAGGLAQLVAAIGVGIFLIFAPFAFPFGIALLVVAVPAAVGAIRRHPVGWAVSLGLDLLVAAVALFDGDVAPMGPTPSVVALVIAATLIAGRKAVGR